MYFSYASTLSSGKMENFLIQRLNTIKRCASAAFNVQKLKRKNFGARKTANQALQRPLNAAVIAGAVAQDASKQNLTELTTDYLFLNSRSLFSKEGEILSTRPRIAILESIRILHSKSCNLYPALMGFASLYPLASDFK